MAQSTQLLNRKGRDMALKVQINGVKKTIADSHNIPYTFVNGEKKRLVKGITFINGVKKVIWNADDLQIDYIYGTSNLFNTYGKVVYVTNNKLILNSGNRVARLDISNPDKPQLEQNVEMGFVCGYSMPDSTASTMVFYSYFPVARDGTGLTTGYRQQININIDDCGVVGSNYAKLTSTAVVNLVGSWLLNGNWLDCISTGSGSTTDFTKQMTFNYGGTSKYSYYYTKNGPYAGTPVIDPFLAKRSGGACLGTAPTSASGNNIVSYDSNNMITRVKNVDFASIMVESDGSFVGAGVSGFGIYNADYSQKVLVPAGTNRACRLIGRIRNYYYVAEGPMTSTAADQSIKLKTFTRDGVLFNERILDGLPAFSWAVGAGAPNTNFLLFSFCIPYVSPNDYLAFTYQPGQDLVGTPSAYRQAVIVRILGY